MKAGYDVAAVRRQFPGLALADGGMARVFLDNPAGTQVPQRVIDRTVEVLTARNANLGGYFATSRLADETVAQAHAAAAAFYNAPRVEEIIFGQNMTTLTFQMARSIGRTLARGDEIVLSRMDHDANIAPWLMIAEDHGLTVRWMEFDPSTYEFPDDALTRVLSRKTRLLAMGMASNCTGTINDCALFTRHAKEAGALVYLDAVQFAPHERLDVQALGADFVVSSAYKWYGPHMGILWGRSDVLGALPAYKVRPVGEELPHKFETGTLSHEGMAGCLAAIEHIAQFGSGDSLAGQISGAWSTIAAYERQLTGYLIAALQTVPKLQIRGISSANALHRRVPTVSFTIEGHAPDALARKLAADNIFVWSGHNYALEPVRMMGLMEKGGVLRVGLAHYNTRDEVDLLLAALNTAIQS